jgi:hypothetical protein
MSQCPFVSQCSFHSWGVCQSFQDVELVKECKVARGFDLLLQPKSLVQRKGGRIVYLPIQIER